MGYTFSGVENQLQNWIRPVEPDRDFVERLRQRLIAVPRTMVESKKNKAPILVILTGALAGFLIYLFVRRAR